jgi:hypothetical protein
MKAPYAPYPGATPWEKAQAYLLATTPAYGLAPQWQRSVMVSEIIRASTAGSNAGDELNTAVGRLNAHLTGDDFRRLVTDAFEEDADAVRTMFDSAAAEMKAAKPKNAGKTEGTKANDVADKTNLSAQSVGDVVVALRATRGRNELEKVQNYLLTQEPAFKQHDRFTQLRAASAFSRGLPRGVQSARDAMNGVLMGGAT